MMTSLDTKWRDPGQNHFELGYTEAIVWVFSEIFLELNVCKCSGVLCGGVNRSGSEQFAALDS